MSLSFPICMMVLVLSVGPACFPGLVQGSNTLESCSEAPVAPPARRAITASPGLSCEGARRDRSQLREVRGCRTETGQAGQTPSCELGRVSDPSGTHPSPTAWPVNWGMGVGLGGHPERVPEAEQTWPGRNQAGEGQGLRRWLASCVSPTGSCVLRYLAKRCFWVCLCSTVELDDLVKQKASPAWVGLIQSIEGPDRRRRKGESIPVRLTAELDIGLLPQD